MTRVERLNGADRQADTVERQGIALAQGGKLRMRRPAGAHVILRVHLEEADWLRLDENGAKMHRLEADASTRRKVRGLAQVQHLRLLGGTNERRAGCGAPPLQNQDLIGWSEPKPFRVLIDSAVPFGTYFHALP